MNRYLLFAGDRHYPRGGWRDFKGGFATTQAAIEMLPILAEEWSCAEFDWWHVIDYLTGEEVVSG